MPCAFDLTSRTVSQLTTPNDEYKLTLKTNDENDFPVDVIFSQIQISDIRI